MTRMEIAGPSRCLISESCTTCADVHGCVLTAVMVTYSILRQEWNADVFSVHTWEPDPDDSEESSEESMDLDDDDSDDEDGGVSPY